MTSQSLKRRVSMIVALILVLATVLSCLAACSGSEKSSDKKDEDKTEETQKSKNNKKDKDTEDTDDEDTDDDGGWLDDDDDEDSEFADLDFNGAEFVILSKQNEDADFTDCYIDNEEMTGEPVNDAVVVRNMTVEEKYNVKISRRAESTGYAREAAMSDTVDFNVVYDWGFRLVPGLMDGIFADMNELNPEYIRLDREYWAPTTQEDLTVANRLFLWTSDISMNRVSWASLIVFNKQLMDNFGLEYPYAYVQNDTWTYDKYLEIANTACKDNGDGVWDQNDVYGSGMIGIGNVVDSSGWTGYKKTADGRYQLDFQLENLQRIYNDYKNKLTGSTFANLGIDDWNKLVDVSRFKSKFRASRFASIGQDHIVMTVFTLDEIQDLEGSESNFGIVPMPKYDASQTEYYHYIDSCAPMFALMKDSDDLLDAVVLEYMSYQSQKLLYPALLEQTVKTSLMSDGEGRDEAMLDIIRGSAHYKFGGVYGVYGINNADGRGWDPIGTMLGEMLSEGEFKAVMNKYQSAAVVSLDKFCDTIKSMD